MSSANSVLFQTAMDKAKQAIALDQAKKKHEAAEMYKEAARLLIDFMKFNKNPKMQEVCKEKATKYLQRAKQLQSPDKIKVKAGGKGGSEDEEVDEDLEALRKTIQGTILTEKPNITWDHIAGMADAKQALQEAIILPIKAPYLFKGSREAWRGILLYGPPGCGKTLLAKAAANECGATFFAADGASLTSKYLGESEKLVKALYEVAFHDAPSLIMLDEIDSLASKRGHQGESSGEMRIKTQLLQEIQGVRTDKKKIVVTLAATNIPWSLDSAILRRFEKRIYIGFPDAEARAKIFALNTKEIEMEEDVDFDELAQMTEGYSGSDIATVCREVNMLPIRELDPKSIREDKEVVLRPISMDDFYETLKKIKPIVPIEEVKRFEEWQEEFGG